MHTKKKKFEKKKVIHLFPVIFEWRLCRQVSSVVNDLQFAKNISTW